MKDFNNQDFNNKIFNNQDLHINIKDIRDYVSNLVVGQQVFLTGKIYTARDVAHERLLELHTQNKKLPICVKNSVIYYTGPTQAPKDMIIGSCGPTSSYRMDGYLQFLLELGLTGTIGKGRRSPECENLIRKYKAVYFMAIGGAGALACKYVKEVKEIAFLDLGCESIKEIYIENFPVTVGVK